MVATAGLHRAKENRVVVTDLVSASAGIIAPSVR